MSKKKEKFTNSDLPHGCQDEGLWRRVVIPTYLEIIGSRTTKEAWILEVSDAEAILGQIWDYIYGARVPYTVRYDGAVYFIVSKYIHLRSIHTTIVY